MDTTTARSLNQRKECDLATPGLGMTFSRSLAIDYSLAIVRHQKTLMAPVAADKKEVNVWVYAHIFSPVTWTLIAIGVSVVAVLLRMTECKTRLLENGAGATLMLMQLSYDTDSCVQGIGRLS